MRNIGNTVYLTLREYTSYGYNVDPAWRQFRFTIGAPDAEAKFKAAIKDVQKDDANARKYPSLYVSGISVCAVFPILTLF